MMLPSNPGPICVFDSGYGGLTILHGLRQTMPQYDYMYLGDNARAPYGSRSFEVVYKFTRQAVLKLFSQPENRSGAWTQLFMERTIWKGVYLTMATTEKIRRDIEKVREKITEQQKRLRALEAQLAEEENLEIVRMVKAVHMDNKELTAFLRAYASGMISLPEGMMEREGTADPDMMEGTDDEE